MVKIERTALVLQSAEQMFDLVNDIDSYPQFLPGCVASRVVSQTQDAVVAELNLAKAGMNFKFTTRNQLERPEKMVIKLVEGPFRTLTGFWNFKALGEDGCRVSLNLNFEISTGIGAAVMGKVFNQVAASLVDAFVKRAEEVYG